MGIYHLLLPILESSYSVPPSENNSDTKEKKKKTSLVKGKKWTPQNSDQKRGFDNSKKDDNHKFQINLLKITQKFHHIPLQTENVMKKYILIQNLSTHLQARTNTKI